MQILKFLINLSNLIMIKMYFYNKAEILSIDFLISTLIKWILMNDFSN